MGWGLTMLTTFWFGGRFGIRTSFAIKQGGVGVEREFASLSSEDRAVLFERITEPPRLSRDQKHVLIKWPHFC